MRGAGDLTKPFCEVKSCEARKTRKLRRSLLSQMTEQFIVGDDVLDVPRSCSGFYEAETITATPSGIKVKL